MNRLSRNKRIVYLCNQIIENDRVIYSEPKKYKVNYQPLSTDGEIIVAGSEHNNRLVVYTSPEIAKDFHNNDRCYVYRNKPENYDRTCTDADFYVNGEPLTYLNESHFYLQRMTGEDYD